MRRALRATAIPLALAALTLGATAAHAAGPSHPAAAPAQAGAISPAGGARLLHRARMLLGVEAGRGAGISTAGRHGGDLTPVLLRLARALPSLPPAQRREARGLLARPTDETDPDGETYSEAEKQHLATDCSEHFCVHWVDDAVFDDAPDLTDASPANGVPDFVDQVEATAENVYSVENGTLGWRQPKPDGVLGGGPQTDIYLVDIGPSLFGYASVDPGQFGRRRYAYLAIDNDFSPAQFPGTTPLTDLEVTLAHEYNHVLQFGYDTFEDIWFMESSAVWMEDQVYGADNDYLRYMQRWSTRPKIPITRFDIKVYGSAVWNHWLSHRYGQSLVRSAWQRTAGNDFAVAAYDAAIRAAGPSDFTLDFARFCRDLAEWRTDTAFPEGDLYPDLQRQGRLPTTGALRYRRLDHTTYRLLRVEPAAAKRLTVDAAGPKGVATALAVVGRVGGETGGTVVSDFALRRSGGRMSVQIGDPDRFDRITVVIVNADAEVNGFGAGDWRYSGNRALVGVRARLIR